MLRDVKKGRSFICSNEGGDEKGSWNGAREVYKHVTYTRVSVFLNSTAFLYKRHTNGIRTVFCA